MADLTKVLHRALSLLTWRRRVLGAESQSELRGGNRQLLFRQRSGEGSEGRSVSFNTPLLQTSCLLSFLRLIK